MLSQLLVLVAPFHRILEPATTCSVFVRPSFAQHQLSYILLECRPYSPYLPLSLSVCVTLSTPVQAGRALPQLRPILEFCLRGTALPRASKEGRVHCNALQGCNAAHCGAKRGGGRHPCNAKCTLLLRSRVERAWHCKEGRERGAGAGDLDSTLPCHAMCCSSCR